MKVYLNITGGPIPYGISGQVDMADLPTDLAQRAETSLQRDYMEKAVNPNRELPLPDEQVYELVVMDPSGKHDQARYVFADSQATPELLDLLDELRVAVTDQQIKQVEVATAESEPAPPAEQAVPAEQAAPKKAKASRKRPPRRR